MLSTFFVSSFFGSSFLGFSFLYVLALGFFGAGFSSFIATVFSFAEVVACSSNILYIKSVLVNFSNFFRLSVVAISFKSETFFF